MVGSYVDRTVPVEPQPDRQSYMMVPLDATLPILHHILKSLSRRDSYKVIVATLNAPVARVMAHLFRLLGDVGDIYEGGGLPTATPGQQVPAPMSSAAFAFAQRGVVFQVKKGSRVNPEVTSVVYVGVPRLEIGMNIYYYYYPHIFTTCSN